MTPTFLSVPRRLTGAVAIVAILVLAGMPDWAWAQDTRQLMDRIERLERDIRLLNVQLARGQAAPAGGGAAASSQAGDSGLYNRLEERLNTLEEEMRSLTGASERLNHAIDEMTRRLDKLVADVDFRLGSVEKPGPGASNTASAPTAPTGSEASAPPARPTQPQTLGTLTESDLRRGGPGSPPASLTPGVQAPAAAPPASPDAQARALLPEGTAAERYNYAQRLVAQAKYDDAEPALRAFLQIHGNDRLAPNARYWLGETYYVRKNYQVASQVFLENYQSAPKGEKAPDNLLKLGMSLSNLEKKREACATFDKLGQEFPGVPDHVKRTILAERQRAGCN